MDETRSTNIRRIAEEIGMAVKDNGDTVQGTTRQISDLIDKVLDEYIMEVAESMTDEEKAIVWIEEDDGVVTMDLGPYIRALGRKLLFGGRQGRDGGFKALYGSLDKATLKIEHDLDGVVVELDEVVYIMHGSFLC